MNTSNDFNKISQDNMTVREYEKQKIASKISIEIMKIRINKDWSQAKLAKQANLKKSVINDIEIKAELPDLDILVRIIHALGARLIITPNDIKIAEIKKLRES